MTSIPKDGVIYSNTEHLVELRPKGAILLRGFSKLFIAKKIEKKSPTTQSNVICLRPGVFAKIKQKKFEKYTHIFHNSNLLTFVPRRDITKITRNTSNSFVTNPRRYIIVLYDPVKNALQRRALSRLVQRTPMIRIRSGVILLPQIRTKRIRLYSTSLIRPSEFLSRIIELGARVWYAPRLELLGANADEIISQLIQSNIEKRAQRIVDKCRSIYLEIKNSQTKHNQSQSYKMALLRLQLQLKLLRKVTQFFRNEFGMDYTKIASRVALAITRVHQQLKICDT